MRRAVSPGWKAEKETRKMSAQDAGKKDIAMQSLEVIDRYEMRLTWTAFSAHGPQRLICRAQLLSAAQLSM